MMCRLHGILMLWLLVIIHTSQASSANEFNPAISLILSGKYSSIVLDPANYTIAGISLAEETGPGEEGLALDESEWIVSANVDDTFYARMTAALTPENSLELEEAYIQTLALPAGTTLQFGRFFSAAGYLNDKHPHSQDFVDTALVYRALMGNAYGDDGIQFRWVLPATRYYEIGVELFRGRGFPFAGAENDGVGVKGIYFLSGGDIGNSHSWQAGYSVLRGTALDRESNAGNTSFNGNVDLDIVELVWKWAPNGNYRHRNLVMQAEYIQRKESGTYTITSVDFAESIRQTGWYIQAAYQFMPRWRVGIRTEQLETDSPVNATGTEIDAEGYRPARQSIMLDYARSEYSRVRLQFNQDQSSQNADRQIYLQYIMSLGAHGAHSF